jgi:hypothetical protein
MTISDRNRAYFEAIGLPEIRRELVVGTVMYLGLDNDPRRIEAREWVAEQDERNRAAERIRTARENKLLSYTFGTLIAESQTCAARFNNDGVAWAQECRITGIKRVHRDLVRWVAGHRSQALWFGLVPRR